MGSGRDGGEGGAPTVPLSDAQRGLLAVMGGDGPAASWARAIPVPLTLRVTGPLVVDDLQTALRLVVARHEALRLRLVRCGDTVAQAFPPPDVGTPSLEIVEAEPDHVPDLVLRLATRDLPTDDSGPLLATLVRIGSHEHVLVVTIDHLATDAWSNGIVAHELWTLYRALRTGAVPRLDGVEWSFTDHLAQLRAAGRSMTGRQLAYWRTVLDGARLASLPRPADGPRAITSPQAHAPAQAHTHAPAPTPTQGRTPRLAQTPEAAADRVSTEGGGGAGPVRGSGGRNRLVVAAVPPHVGELARRARVTPNAVLLTTVFLALWRQTGDDDLTVSFVYHGRDERRAQVTVGFLAREVPVRWHVDPALTLGAAAHQVMLRTMEAIGHSRPPYPALLVREVLATGEAVLGEGVAAPVAVDGVGVACEFFVSPPVDLGELDDPSGDRVRIEPLPTFSPAYEPPVVDPHLLVIGGADAPGPALFGAHSPTLLDPAVVGSLFAEVRRMLHATGPEDVDRRLDDLVQP